MTSTLPPPKPLSDDDRSTILAEAKDWSSKFRKRVHAIEDLTPEDWSQIAKGLMTSQVHVTPRHSIA